MLDYEGVIEEPTKTQVSLPPLANQYKLPSDQSEKEKSFVISNIQNPPEEYEDEDFDEFIKSVKQSRDKSTYRTVNEASTINSIDNRQTSRTPIKLTGRNITNEKSVNLTLNTSSTKPKDYTTKITLPSVKSHRITSHSHVSTMMAAKRVREANNSVFSTSNHDSEP